MPDVCWTPSGYPRSAALVRIRAERPPSGEPVLAIDEPRSAGKCERMPDWDRELFDALLDDHFEDCDDPACPVCGDSVQRTARVPEQSTEPAMDRFMALTDGEPGRHRASKK